MTRTIICGVFLFFASGLLFAQNEYFVQPSATDPAIDGKNDFHFAYFNDTLTPLNRLFVFFPGTYGTPQAYREILKVAANMGHHAIGLTYPNDTAFADVCALTTDTNCQKYGRLEIFDGIDRHAVIDVDVPNSIQYRLIRLLQYLEATYPADNWGQYLDSNDSLVWNQLKLSGHSQGAGHAGIISKYRQVDRVVLFAGMDWNNGQPANWIRESGLTPTNKYYGFTHLRDPNFFSPLPLQEDIWAAYGMDAFGLLVNIDTLGAPYNYSHMLTTDEKPDSFLGDSTNYHGSVAVSVYTPKDSLGAPLFQPVWEYLIGGSSGTGRVAPLRQPYLSLYPDPAQDWLQISRTEMQGKVRIILLDVLGQTVKRQEIVFFQGRHTLPVGELPAGIYIVVLQQGRLSVSGKFIKK